MIDFDLGRLSEHVIETMLWVLEALGESNEIEIRGSEPETRVHPQSCSFSAWNRNGCGEFNHGPLTGRNVYRTCEVDGPVKGRGEMLVTRCVKSIVNPAFLASLGNMGFDRRG